MRFSLRENRGSPQVLFLPSRKAGRSLTFDRERRAGSRGVPDSDTKAEDDRRARDTLRYVLCCDVLTAAIPGLITIDHVKNAAQAVTQRREFDAAESRRYQEMVEEMWANLPHHYKWLRDWEWV